jgi:hypothetical protein
MSAQGLLNPKERVRYEAGQCIGLLLMELAPTFQTKYAGDLVPVLLRMMREEQHFKMQTQAVSVMT